MKTYGGVKVGVGGGWSASEVNVKIMETVDRIHLAEDRTQ
jgi:hypothetical protein